jgi:hypothetical protein
MIFDPLKVTGSGHPMEERLWFRDSAIRITERFGPRAVIVNIGVARGASMHAFRAGARQSTCY